MSYLNLEDKRRSGYAAYEESSSKIYPIIAAILENYLKLAVISEKIQMKQYLQNLLMNLHLPYKGGKKEINPVQVGMH